MRDSFSKEEAAAKIGQSVRALANFSGVSAFSGVPKGTTGKVVRIDSTGKEPEGFPEFIVAVEWDLLATDYHNEDMTISQIPGEPLEDWFRKWEYDRYLLEEENQMKKRG